MKKSLCIVHFQPIEKYPPAFNLLRILVREGSFQSIHVYTTSTVSEKMVIEGMTIHRLPSVKPGMGKLRRIGIYIYFLIRTLVSICRIWPSTVLYFETISAGAPLLYKKFINKKARLFIHYHEYTTQPEYNSGMFFTRQLHHLEKKTFKTASWVSHTNEERMELFKEDLGEYAPLNTYIMPNYPPASWYMPGAKYKKLRNLPIRFVYVGALSIETLYLKETAEWVASNAGKCFWDIYSDNIALGVLDYFVKLDAPNISFKGAVKYDSLPEVLTSYDIGLILYKGHIPNYIFNAPNKLFEYYACGIDTWFPKQMIGCRPYSTTGTLPKINAVDFDQLREISIEQLMTDCDLHFQQHIYQAEETCRPIITALAATN